MSNTISAPAGVTIRQGSYDQTILSYGTDGTTVTGVLFTGGTVTLSSIVNNFLDTGGELLQIYADTLIVDVPNFNALAVTVVARKVDITSLGNQDWLIQMPASGSMYPVLECLIMETANQGNPASLTFTTCQTINPPANEVYTAPSNSGNGTLSIGSIEVNADSSITVLTTGQNDFIDLISRPYALNMFYASFANASSMIDADGTASNAAAFSVLSWICNCIQSCGTVPDTHQEIYAQASSLLVTLNAPANYHYLGVLSSAFYSTQINNLITVVSEYETSLNNLAAQSSDQGIINTVSTAMCNTAAAEMAPANVELAQVKSAVASIYADIQQLNSDISGQVNIANTQADLLINAIAQSTIQNFISNSIKTVTSVLDAADAIAGAVASDGKGAGAAIGKVVTAVQNGITTIQQQTASYNTGSLLSDAQAILQQQQGMLQNVLSSQQLWYQVTNGYTPEVAFQPVPLTIDPNTAWDNFMASATAVLSNLDASFPTGTSFLSAQQQSNSYLASLQELANYGKAFNGQMVAYSKQLCQGVALLAKQTALSNIQAIWSSLAAASQTEEEQFVALQGLLQNRMNASMRSLFISWTNYRSVYLYNTLTEPTENITLDMAPADLSAAFTSVQGWVAGIPGNGGTTTTQLPNDNATITMSIPVVAQGTANPPASVPAGLYATIQATPSDPSYAATITLHIPDVLNQFGNEIGTGEVAIWVTQGSFQLNGAGANTAGYVPMTVATSGQYVNGYSSDLMHFASNAISSHYSYKPGNGGNITVNVPWNINSEVYTLPTPFTLWTFKIDQGCDVSAIQSLDINFTVNLQFQN